MTVGQLMEALNQYPPDTVIVLSSDAEGNSYSPLSGFDDNCVYVADSTWSGYIKPAYLTEEMIKGGWDESDVYGFVSDEEEPESGGVFAIVLWPVN